MQVDRTNDGTWRVIAADGEVLASGLSNAEAWRFIDSHDETAADDAEASDWAVRFPQWTADFMRSDLVWVDEGDFGRFDAREMNDH
jgi:hypothetical protein